MKSLAYTVHTPQPKQDTLICIFLMETKLGLVKLGANVYFAYSNVGLSNQAPLQSTSVEDP